MSRSVRHTATLRRPAGLAALLTATALVTTACGSGGAEPTVVTVTATSAEDAGAQAAGPVPTGTNGEPLVGGGNGTGNSSGDAPAGTSPTPGSSPAQGQQSAPGASGTDSGTDAGTTGQIVLTGTVVDMTTSEIMDGQPSPNGEPESNGYIVLQLDSPQQVTAQKSGAPGQPGTKTVSQISLATPSGSLSSVDWTGYVGQHVTVTTTADGLWLPSDTGLPLGMVRMKEGTVQ